MLVKIINQIMTILNLRYSDNKYKTFYMGTLAPRGQPINVKNGMPGINKI